MESFKQFFEEFKKSDTFKLIMEKISLVKDESEANVYNLNIDHTDMSAASKQEISTQVGWKRAGLPALYHVNIDDPDLTGASAKITGNVWALFSAPDNVHVSNIYEIIKTIFKENALENFENPLEVTIHDEEYNRKKVLVKYNPLKLSAFIDYAVEQTVKFMTGEVKSNFSDYEKRHFANKDLDAIINDLKFDIIINIKSSSPLNKIFKNKLITKLKEFYKNKLEYYDSNDFVVYMKRKYPAETEVKIGERIKAAVDDFNKKNFNVDLLNIDDFIFKGDIKRVLVMIDKVQEEPTEKEIKEAEIEIKKENPKSTKAELKELSEAWKKKYNKDKRTLKQQLKRIYENIQKDKKVDLKKLHTSVRKFIVDFMDVDINNFTQEQIDNMTGKNILVIDDIITSRSTMIDTIRQLKILDPKKVTGLVIFK